MILDDIYDAAVDTPAFAALPAKLAQWAGARSMTLHTYSSRRELLSVDYSYFDRTMMEALIVDEMWRHDLWAEIGLAKARPGRVLSTDDYIRPADFKASVIYNEFFRRFGDDSVHCFGAVFRGEEATFTMGLHRGDRAGAFCGREVNRLQRLVPHLERAMIMRGRLKRANQEAEDCHDAFNRLSVAIIRLDGDGRAAFLNASAETLVRSKLGLTICHDRIRLENHSAQARLDEAIRAATRRTGAYGGGLTAPRGPLGHPLRIVVAPTGVTHRCSALVLVDDPASPQSGSPSVLAAVFGLTKAEADLAVALTQGLTPEEIAEKRQTSLGTIRSQVRGLLNKTERRRLTEAIMDFARIASIAPPD